jgi:uncharacterized membrane protein YeaQ/YmgE (transglycosylase-associated protein family)
MFDYSEVLAWIAIGAGAGIVGNLWHARRDAAGVVAKMLVGPAGAVIGGALGGVLFPYGRARMRMFDAAFFAFCALALLHFFWVIARNRFASSEAHLEVDAPGNKILNPAVSPRGMAPGAPAHPTRAAK